VVVDTQAHVYTGSVVDLLPARGVVQNGEAVSLAREKACVTTRVTKKRLRFPRVVWAHF